MKIKDLPRILLESAEMSSMILIILAFAYSFAFLLSFHRIPDMLTQMMFDAGITPWVSKVSTAPETTTEMASATRSTAKVWHRLPKWSVHGVTRPGASTCQWSTDCAVLDRGVSRKYCTPCTTGSA